MQDQLFDMLVNKDEITWQNLIYDLVKSEQMDPWDIDVGLLVKRYLDTLKKLKEANFLISGKVVLAAAILLYIKSHKLINEDIANLDLILFGKEEEEFEGSLLDELEEEKEDIDLSLIPKVPHVRKRKVSVDDLIKALQKALEVDKRRTLRRIRDQALKVEIPEKKVDISKLIKEVFDKIKKFLSTKEVVTFNELVGSNRKEDKIQTFIPLLHLTQQQEIDLNQEEHFGEIKITLYKNG